MTKQDHEDTFPIHINNQQDYIVHVMRDQHTLVTNGTPVGVGGVGGVGGGRCTSFFFSYSHHRTATITNNKLKGINKFCFIALLILS